jgi:hypothetical protein
MATVPASTTSPATQPGRAGPHHRGGPRGEEAEAERGGRGQQPDHVGRFVVARPPTAAKTITETMSALIASAGIRLRVTRSE